MNPFASKKSEPVKAIGNQVRDIRWNGLRWLDIVKPTDSDIAMIGQEFELHELSLEDCTTEHQRSKIDDFDNYCFIVLHLPRYRKKLMRLDSEEIDIFIGSNYIITLHEGELKPLTYLSYMCSSKQEYKAEFMSEGSALLLYEIIKRLLDYCFPMLDKIGVRVDDINKNVFQSRGKAMLENISRARMQIINYMMIMKPLRPVILTLEKRIVRFLPEDSEMYFDDITDKAEQIWNMLENYKEVVESLDATFTSLTNHRINNLMRTFTIVQVITLPMVLVGGLFSMNVKGIPMNNNSAAFWIVLGMVLIPTFLISLLIFIKRNKWL